MITKQVGALTYLDEPYELIDAPLWYHKQGISQTVTGYGGKLNTGRKVRLASGKLYRLYCMCYGNSGTRYILTKGQIVIVS